MRNGLIRFKAAALCVAACFGSVQAAPTLPKVVAGQASFSQQGNVFSITNTPGAIINWQSFSVNAGEVTRFIQQGSDSAVLNRIVGQDPSRILGALQSNGKVFVINPNGVVFGQGARVDVNGLVASTLNLSDADFSAGKMNFTAGATAGAIRNEGSITTPHGGKVFLVAPNVENTGVITAPGGQVVLAAGRSVQLVDSNDPDLRIVVSAPADQAVNLGQVVAQGGRIGIYGALVNQRGVVNANSAVLGQDGKIILKASRDTVLEAGSVTSATGAGKGGEIELLGQRVGLAGNAAVDASGVTQGGMVLVGGDYQGKNTLLPNAQQTWFGKDASIRADATGSGDGGKVVLWSDGATTAQGSISARGAGLGAGGLVETSGHALDTAGIRVDAGAASGRTGTWLLDPWNIIVRSDGTAPASSVDVFSKPPTTSGDTVVSSATLKATDANIVLQARNDLYIDEALATPHGVRAEAGHDLVVNAVVQAGGDIDLRAGNHLTIGGTGALKSANYIDLKAERMTFGGSIGGVDGVAPIVSFSTFNKATPISVKGLTTQDRGMLVLDPERLAGFDTFGITIGDSGHTGTIIIEDRLQLAGNLVIDNAGAINVDALVRLSGEDSQFIGTLHPHLGGGGTRVTGRGAIESGRKIGLGGGAINVEGALASNSIAIESGPGGIELAGSLDAAGLMTLRSTGAVNQSATSVVKAQNLLVDGATVVMQGANAVGRLAGAASGTHFRFNWTGALDIGSIEEMAGVKAGVEVGLTGGMLVANAGIEGAAITVDADAIGGSGSFKANVLQLNSRGGIGSAGAPLQTSALVLSATNTATGSAPINIVNDRALTVTDVVQAGSGNAGAISIDSTGGLTVAPTTEGQGVKTSSGNISLVTHSPMTILGRVTSDSGDIRLLADNGGALSISGGGAVATGSGSVSVTAGTTSIAPGSISVSSPDKLTVVSSNTPTNPTTPTTPPPDPVPPLDTCIASPNAPGCAGVIETAVRGCIVNPDGPTCGQVLPTVDVCRANADVLGCAVALQRAAVLACIANPGGPNCGSVLPAYETCTAAPGTLGCVPVLAARAALDACIANPKAGGCAAVLPSLTQCRVDASVLGCAPVLARAEFDACLVNPLGAGCAAVLPALPVCKASPGTEGCDRVLQVTFDACLVNPQDASCTGVLPTLSQCVADKTRAGCAVVLPTLAQCVASPSLAGCSVQLPTLAQCVVNKAAPGCDVVLPTLAQCVASPALAGCSVQLPTLVQCVVNKSAPGCDVVLPTLAQCVASPSLQGCSVQLPTLAQCVANRAAPGCGAVLPTLAQCTASPALAGCSVQLPTLGQCVADKAAAGCSAVLPTLAQCVANASLAGCVAQLPTLSQCVSDKSAPGCSAVLPTLGQCVASPTLQGCSVQLPTLSQCAANPTLGGCEAVLPTPSTCALNPLAPSCAPFTPTPTGSGGQVTTVTQSQTTTVALIQASTPLQPVIQPPVVANTPAAGTSSSEDGGKPADKAEQKSAPAPGTNPGVKNDTVKKMYCN